MYIYIYIYMCMDIYRRLGGLERQRPQPGNRFVSFVRACVRARWISFNGLFKLLSGIILFLARLFALWPRPFLKLLFLFCVFVVIWRRFALCPRPCPLRVDFCCCLEILPLAWPRCLPLASSGLDVCPWPRLASIFALGLVWPRLLPFGICLF